MVKTDDRRLFTVLLVAALKGACAGRSLAEAPNWGGGSSTLERTLIRKVIVLESGEGD
jgi:hypothetical protein